ncbi:MAG: DUF3857 domain-containing protein [Deltaproteobacteria bacterium]|nr:DUF3857 domain-containing protein [Deltaproteobacteria bacterium]
MKYVVGVGVGVVLAIARAADAAPDALEKAPFTATPAELRAAAAATPASDADVTVLRIETFVTFDERGAATSRRRTIARIDRAPGIEAWDWFELNWTPSYQDTPSARIRVIASDGSVATLDPALLRVGPPAPAATASDHGYLGMPRPPLQVGSIVEEEVTTVDRTPALAAGSASRVWITQPEPVVHAELTIDAPTARHIQIVPRGFATAPTPRTTTRAGRTTWSYRFDAVPAASDETFLPGELVDGEMIGVSAMPSWAAIATELGRGVDEALRPGLAMPAGVPGRTARETVDHATAWLQAHVHRAFGPITIAGVAPRAPAATIAAGSGSPRDRAVVLVALLRGAGLPAEVALIAPGAGTDVDRALPEIEALDHPLVRTRLDGVDLWIDPAEAALPAGQLSDRDQGRLALVLARDTQDLVATPSSTSADNGIRKLRTLRVSEFREGSATEVTEERGVFADHLRGWLADIPAGDTKATFGAYVRGVFQGDLARISHNATAPVTEPFRLTLEVASASAVFTDRMDTEVDLMPGDVFAELPPQLADPDPDMAAEVAARRRDFRMPAPHVYEIENRVVLVPDYFVAPTLVAHETAALGTMTLDTTRRVEGDTLVITYRLDTGKARLTPAELAADRAAVRAQLARGRERLALTTVVGRLLDQRKYPEAIAECQRMIARHPKEAVHYGNLAITYRNAGAIAAARRAAKQGTLVEPRLAGAFSLAGFEYRFASNGRRYGDDADRAAAITADRKAIALAPDQPGALADLADALFHDAAGRVTDDPRDRAEAIALWRRAKDAAGDGRFATELAEAMMIAGAFTDAEAEAAALPASDDATALRVAAMAGARTPDDAIAFARSHASGKGLATLLARAETWLLRARAYDAARAIMAARDHVGAAELAGVGRVHPTDNATLDPADPLRPVTFLMLASLGLPVPARPWDEATNRAIEGSATAYDAKVDLPAQKFSAAALRDGILARVALQVEGDAREGWRVAVISPAGTDAVYVELDHGVATAIGSPLNPAGLGGAILRHLAQRDHAGAARWLQRLSDDAARATKPLGPDETLAFKLFRDEVARAGTAAPAPAVIETAAALLAARGYPALAAPALRRCAVGDDQVAHACRGRLLSALMLLERWADAASVADEITAADPAHREGIERHAVALVRLGRPAAAIKLVDDALASAPTDHDLVEIRAEIALTAEHAPLTAPAVAQLFALPTVEEWDANNLAWTSIGSGGDPEAARALTVTAEAKRPMTPTFANTIAFIEAAAGRPASAWVYARRSFSPTRIDAADWLVIGRIAEAYGLRDDAIAAYRRVTKGPTLSLQPTSYDLAQRGLARLHARKP